MPPTGVGCTPIVAQTYTHGKKKNHSLVIFLHSEHHNTCETRSENDT